MKTLFQILHGAGYLSPRFNNDDREKIGCTNKEQCLFHPETNDHFIEDCCEFKNKVQKLMDAKILLIGQMSMQEIKPKAMTVEIPGPFAYKDNHAVPWKYECQFITDNVVSTTVEGITRNGRCYTPDNLKDVSKEDEVRQRKGKAIEMAGEDDLDDLNDLSKVFTEKITLVGKETDNEVVSKEEAYEEIPPEGTGHTKALHISVKCKLTCTCYAMDLNDEKGRDNHQADLLCSGPRTELWDSVM
ncbi:Gag-pro-like protein [Cucumis melo var. makuwa]|uniref:Gag-pro-like protein n=1 Tax=Cucumis melo var. makuwa TaxID=1194695 RepID=A0A5D3D266_CUCMM|nr:Gag-pro-like protein [Cucumis melo var. makuwa]TYK16836.1 Gag-pro-like protein [Cucumis melo var. makuwa]